MLKKTAVITGASSGIGLELARLIAADGYNLIVTARRADRLQQLAEELKSLHDTTVSIIEMDIAKPFAGDSLWQAILSITPDVDILVNNAGFGEASSFADESTENIERMIHLNISTLTSLTRQILPGMIKRESGRILNVASLAGFQPGGPGMSVYYASKSYVLSFSRSIRRELSGTGVSVTTLCPGATQTEFEETANAQGTRLFNLAKPMDAKAVAIAGYRGLVRGCGVVIPGLMNKVLAYSVKISPTALALEVNRFLLNKKR